MGKYIKEISLEKISPHHAIAVRRFVFEIFLAAILATALEGLLKQGLIIDLIIFFGVIAASELTYFIIRKSSKETKKKVKKIILIAFKLVLIVSFSIVIIKWLISWIGFLNR